jgi:L-threonylcarbamoyladenylate synthase
MPVLPIEGRSVEEAIAALRSGSPIVFPAPSPLPYAIAGMEAAAVNTAKGRPADQPAGLSVADLDVVAPYLDVADGVLAMARWLCESELVSLLVPVRPGGPGWLSPATAEGMLGFTSAPWLPDIAKIITEFGHLYVSSANRAGGRPATTAAEAGQAFGDRLVVLDGDPLRDRSGPHGSTTIVRVSRDGDLAVARPGINDQVFGQGLKDYAAYLAARWRARGLSSTRLRGAAANGAHVAGELPGDRERSETVDNGAGLAADFVGSSEPERLKEDRTMATETMAIGEPLTDARLDAP